MLFAFLATTPEEIDDSFVVLTEESVARVAPKSCWCFVDEYIIGSVMDCNTAFGSAAIGTRTTRDFPHSSMTVA